ncbi:MAG: patatin-like phospholipase family protein [Alphaproteobacteria bacterium]|nr:patatin-like phospholipase family protein [Alphaproteobacteria bacterium]MBV8547879.1 patatin-like phospholipase family protein [Alphaproteobacteria bacterium]
MADIKTINLALQGGGAHGAFTWGVLDRLLEEDDRLKIEGISGTSAGAMNGAAMLQGYTHGGAAGAKKALEEYWRGVGGIASFELPKRSLFDQMVGNWNIDNSPFTAMTDVMQRMFSPYQTNPFNLNPLRDLVTDMIDVDAIKANTTTKFFVSATNVETGHARIFEKKELTVDVLMASACLPFAFQAVTIQGAPYWDGGYVGNPALFPLIYNCESPDIMVVQINPLVRRGVPESAADILNRLNEITFNASLVAEMRAISFVQRLIDEDHLKNPETHRLKRMNMHVVEADDEIRTLGAASKYNIQMDFLLHLRSVGRVAADAWLKSNWSKIGVESSVNIYNVYLNA